MKTKNFVSISILLSLTLVLSIVIVGCKKQPQVTESNQPTSAGAAGEEATVQKWTCPMHPDVISDKPGECPKCGMDLVPLKSEKDVNTVAAAMSADIEQKMCPVLANMPIDRNIWVEYQGKKVYFCCADCKAKFQKEPEKYLSKLPQFSK